MKPAELVKKLADEYKTKTQFAAELGVSKTFLYQIYTGRRKIPPKFALRIQKLTSGRITAEMLRPDIFED